MDRVFAVILEASIYGSLVGLVILLSKRLLKTRLNSKWHFLLWALLLIKLVFPFGPESNISLFNVVPPVPTQVLLQPAAPVVDPTPTPGWVDPRPPAPGVSEQSATSQGRTTLTLGSIAAYMWVSGVIALTGWLLVSLWLFNKKLSSSRTITNPNLLQVFQSAKLKMKVTGPVNLLLSESVETPSLFGVLRPRILLPAYASELSEKELEYIQLHELAHYRRKDVLINYLLLVVQTIHWFNPVVWYLFKCIRQDMELATDELVLSTLETTEHKDYGRALLTVLASFSEPKLSGKLVYMADDKANIERRINMIRMAALLKHKGKAVLLAGVLCLTILGTVLLTNGVPRGSAATEYGLIEVHGFNGDWAGESFEQASLIFALSKPDTTSVSTAIQSSSKMPGILDVTIPHYVLKLIDLNGNAEPVFLWLPDDPTSGKGMIMYPSDSHTGYSLSSKDTALLVGLFSSKMTRSVSVQIIERVDLATVFYEPESFVVDAWGNLKEAQSVGTVLNQPEVYKLTRGAGATVNEIIYFTYVDGAPKLLVGFYAAEAWEVDVNSDGTRDIVYTFGSPGPNARVITATGKQLLEADLNTAFITRSVEFIPASNQFLVTYPFEDPIAYWFEPGTWMLRR